MPITHSNRYFHFEQQNPDAIVIANRGERAIEQDLTPAVISFNTSNSIDSVSGNFTLVIDNTNDRFMSRFGFSRISKMSSIEIFVKNPKATSDGKDPGKFNISQTVQLGDNIGFNDPSAGELSFKNFFEQYYQGQEDNKLSIIQDLNRFNKDLKKPTKVYKIDILQVVNNDEKRVRNVDVNVSTDTITVSFLPDQDQQGNLINRDDIVIEADSIISYDQSEVKFTQLKESLKPLLKTREIVTNETTIRSVFEDGELLVENNNSFNQKAIGTNIKIPAPTNLYPRIFLGVVLAVAQNVTPGSNMTITLSGKGIGYWLEASKVNTFPGGYEQPLTNLNLSNFANRYADYPAIEIFRDLIRFSTDDLISISNFNLNTAQTAKEFLTSTSYFEGKPIKDPFGNDAKTVALNPQTGKFEETDLVRKFKNKSVTQQKNEIDEMENRIYRGIPMRASETSASATSLGLTKDSNWSNLGRQVVDKEEAIKNAEKAIAEVELKLRALGVNAKNQSQAALATEKRSIQRDLRGKEAALKSLENDLGRLKEEIDKIPAAQADIQALNINRETLNRDEAIIYGNNRKKFFENFNIIEHWKKIFSKIILEVMDKEDYLNYVYPFKWDIRAPGASMDGEYQSKESLAKLVAEKIFFEFYFDSNGHFVLKPPLYSMDAVELDDVNYIIEDEDVTSMSLNDTAEGIITRVGVAGDYKESQGIEKVMIYSIFQDMRLIRDFGFHAQEFAELLFIHNNAEARDFAQAMLSKLNMNLVNGSVTIIGRPEVRIGMSVYLKPRDTIYYIREISHAFTAGGEYQTTLTLIGGRRIIVGRKVKKDLITVTFNEASRQDADQPITKVGKSQSIEYYEVKNDDIEFLEKEQYSINANREEDVKKLVSSIKKQQRVINSSLSRSLSESDLNKLIAQRNENINSLRAVIPNDVRVEDPDKLADQLLTSKIDLTLNDAPYIILKNKYVITSHINPLYIGLVVDNDQNGLFGLINKESYDFIKNLNINSLAKNFSDLGLKDDKKTKYVKIIKEAFDAFAEDQGITEQNANKEFTIDKREGFQLQFLRDVGAYLIATDDVEIPEDNLVLGIETSFTDDELAESAKLFNYIINDINTYQGFYVQYTDDVGREFPAYLDYGKSLTVQNGNLVIDEAKTASKLGDDAKKREKEIKKAASRAAKIKNSGEYKNLVDIAKERFKTDNSERIAGGTFSGQVKRKQKTAGALESAQNFADTKRRNQRSVWRLN